MLKVRFWGTRGSIPCPGHDTVEFGGNTSCLEIRAGERLVILDMGTGIRPLGDWLMTNDYKQNGYIDADIFITHTHWDHIMGFPVFTPNYVPGNKLRIRGPVSFEGDTLESIISNQLSYRYWPIRASELAANIEYDQIRETSLDLGRGLLVTTKYLNHPILCLGYRFEYQGKSIVTAYDHEPFRNLFPTDPAENGYNEDAAREGELAAAEENEKLLRFFQDADILIHDAQYTEDEFTTHLGWGHSSYGQTIDAAMKANVKKLAFFHHDPARTDSRLEELEKIYQADYRGKMSLEPMMAREGMTLEA
ncbi:MAG: MBL fold metallo-hydrolase [Treponema sp.]|nr:MBL fold metallo-hydrolase [Treponema sp.]